MSSEITPRVISVIAKVKHLDRATVRPESTFQELGIDSLDGLEIAFGLENEFDVDIPDESLPGLKRVSDIAAALDQLLAQKGAV